MTQTCYFELTSLQQIFRFGRHLLFGTLLMPVRVSIVVEYSAEMHRHVERLIQLLQQHLESTWRWRTMADDGVYGSVAEEWTRRGKRSVGATMRPDSTDIVGFKGKLNGRPHAGMTASIPCRLARTSIPTTTSTSTMAQLTLQ